MDVCGEYNRERHVLHVARRHCPHCNKYISLKTFKAHRRLYHNSENGEWYTIHKSRFEVEEESSSACESENDNIEFSDSQPLCTKGM